MKKIPITAFENKEEQQIGPPDDFLPVQGTACVIPVDKLFNVKESSDGSVQGNYTANVIVKGMVIDG